MAGSRASAWRPPDDPVPPRLAEIGYRGVEPFTFYGWTAERFDALLDGHGLRATSRHGDTNETTWDAEPGLWSYEDTLETAATLDRLGSRSVRNGTGKIFVHQPSTTPSPPPPPGR